MADPSRRTRAPAPASTCATAMTAPSLPEITTYPGPLTAAMRTRPGAPAPATRPPLLPCRDRRHAPPPGSACISLPRAATSTHASASDSIPATRRRRTPPPMTRHQIRGTRPTTPQQPGQAHLQREQPRLGEQVCSPARHRASPVGEDHLTQRAAQQRIQQPAHLLDASANTGNRRQLRPIPARCAPCPANTNATFGASAPGAAVPWTAPSAGYPGRHRRGPRRQPVRRGPDDGGPVLKRALVAASAARHRPGPQGPGRLRYAARRPAWARSPAVRPGHQPRHGGRGGHLSEGRRRYRLPRHRGPEAAPQNHVAVGAAHAEGAHPGQERPVLRGHAERALDPEPQLVQRDPGLGVAKLRLGGISWG